ncbi:membrane protein [Desulfuromonas versatilis]|uniref:Membrane protein n=1 Tax=Desulfuromonas versatilis TaxID=2802975 RepID=A0ABN6E115_9BACT|nr:OmpA family protein [Desulfuromonas versatilis]BCR04841.1 membrane protein [Desulfuromonas versatilis]
MMKGCFKALLPCLVSALVLALAVPAAARAELVKKVDNFIVFIDQSGSMSQKYAKTGKKKIELALEQVKGLDKAIPELGYQGSVALSSPQQTLSPVAVFKSGALASVASAVDSDFYIFGRETSLGDDLGTLAPTLNGFSGRTALVLFTDGDNNAGTDPVAVASELYNRYGKQLCIHVVSYADEDNGKQIIEKLRAISDCTVVADGNSLAAEPAMAQFARDVFYGEGAPVIGDADGDGVLDDRDKCPDTIRGSIVDADGCAVKYTLQIEFDFDKSDIRAQYRKEIAKAAEFIKRYPQVKILVAGHTDNTGSPEYNKGLSMRRAQALKDYLVKNFGISPGLLFPRGYGETRPVASNKTKDGRQKNRRVEFICSTEIQPDK